MLITVVPLSQGLIGRKIAEVGTEGVCEVPAERPGASWFADQELPLLPQGCRFDSTDLSLQY